jgi:oxalate decarboxylase/phosphoglucose isomerase-like protein (cupin superfamily)
MKYFLYLPVLFLSSLLMGQSDKTFGSNEKVIIDNDKLKVIEYFSMPQGNVCGEGMHYHEPHLTVVLSDAKVLITPENGESQTVEVKSGASIWFDSETHSVINTGDKPTRMLLVYVKE